MACSREPRAAFLAWTLTASVAGAQFTERVSVVNLPNGNVTEADSSSLGPPAASADGRFVAFTSLASNLAPGADATRWRTSTSPTSRPG